MNIDDFRRLEIAAACALLGLERDPGDFKQFLGDGHRISFNGVKWFDHEAGKGGGGSIDLVMHIKQLGFMAAINYMSSLSGEIATITTRSKASGQRITKPPEPDTNKLPVVTAYLTDKRCLNRDLVQWCMDKGLIYADARANCVFRYGSTGAELRGTGAVQWRGVYGTIESGFILPASEAVGIAVVESAIDALSYKQIRRNRVTISIAGNGNHKVMAQAINIAIAKGLPIISAFDSDKGGDIANRLLHDLAGRDVAIVGDRPINGKDWNDELTRRK